MKIGSRKVTVSTVGFPDRLRKLAPQKPRFQLAISLHTPDQEQRDVLVPAMKGVPIDEMLAAGDDWFEKTGREVTYEYVLLGGENDSTATRAASRCVARPPLHREPDPVQSGRRKPLPPPDARRVEAFRETLVEAEASSRPCAGRAGWRATRPADSCACDGSHNARALERGRRRRGGWRRRAGPGGCGAGDRRGPGGRAPGPAVRAHGRPAANLCAPALSLPSLPPFFFRNTV